MVKQFATRMAQLGTESAIEVFSKAKRLEDEGQSIIHLEIGQPDFKTAENISEVAFQAVEDGYTGYSPSSGLIELRQSIAEHISATRQIPVYADEVVVMPGAKPVIFFALMALVNPGDEVIYPDPGFPIYESVTKFVGATPVPLPLVEAVDFRFRVDDLKARLSERTKLLILNSPHNPTGGMLTVEDLEAIAQLAEEYDFYILSDEIYSRIIYDETHHSIVSQPGMKERTIVLDGYSKTYSMTGWRLGYGVMPRPLAEQMDLLMVNSNSCTCSFIQVAGVEALEGPQDFVATMVDEFRRRRDFMVEALNKIPGISCLTPAGAFYTFPNVKDLPLSDRDLADYLLHKAGVAVLPGSSFGQCGTGYLRLSYANSYENIELAMERMATALKQL